MEYSGHPAQDSITVSWQRIRSHIASATKGGGSTIEISQVQEKGVGVAGQEELILAPPVIALGTVFTVS